MARFMEPTQEQEEAWKDWLASLPDCVRVVAECFDPWSLYRMKSTGQRVAIASFFEDATLSVNVTGEFNIVVFDRAVFGIKPDDLEPCDLPEKDEQIGTMMSSEQVDENIDALRVIVRPDLWEMGDDGIAHQRQQR